MMSWIPVASVRSRGSLRPGGRVGWRSAGGLFACVALTYLVGAVLSGQSFGAGVGPAFFPPAGVTVAAMLLTPRSRWAVIVLAIVVAEVAVDLYYGVGVAAKSGFALANSVEPVVGASLVLAWCNGPPDLRVRADLAKFVAAACGAGPRVGGLIGSGVSAVSSGASWPVAAVHWWAGDGIGVLVVGAPILLWPIQSHILRARIPETALVVALTVVLSLTAFWWQAPPTFLLLPVMAWAAFRLDVIGAAVAGAVLGFSVNHLAGSGRGFFAGMNLAAPARLAVNQMFIAVIVLVAMLIAQEAAGRIAAARQGEAERRESGGRRRGGRKRGARPPGRRTTATPGATGAAVVCCVDAEPHWRRGR